MKAHRPLSWKELGWVEEAKFPNSRGARLYPLLRMDPMGPDTPLVGTPLGEARLLSVGESTADVLVEHEKVGYENKLATRQKGEEKAKPPRRRTLPHHHVTPPPSPPPDWQVEAVRAEVRRLAPATRRSQAASEFVKSLSVCSVLWLSTFALLSWLFPGAT